MVVAIPSCECEVYLLALFSLHALHVSLRYISWPYFHFTHFIRREEFVGWCGAFCQL